MVIRKRRSELSLPQIGYVWDRYNYASSTRDAVICWRVHYLGKVKVVSTGIRVFKGEWDKRYQRVVNRPDAAIINKQLDKLIQDIREVVYDMYNDGNIDIYAIESKLLGKRKPNQTFLDFCEERAKIRKYGKATDSQERYERFLKFLITWGKIKTFYDLTDAKVMELDRYLKGKNDMKAKSRWNNYHRFLNSFILDAQKEGLVTVNPYDKVKIDHGDDSEGIDKFLYPDEFQKLRAAEMPTERLARIRDLFVFQTFTCLAYRDLAEFSMKKVRDVELNKVLSGKRGKTNIQYIVPLLTPAREILAKYKGLPASMTPKRKTTGKILTNQKYNDALKEVMEAAGIDRPVTSHWARHTGATLLLNAGVPLVVVSKVCGHSSIKMTEKIYAKLLQHTVVEEVMKVEDKII